MTLTASSGPSPGACSVRTCWGNKNPPLLFVVGERDGEDRVGRPVARGREAMGEESTGERDKATERRGEDEGWMDGYTHGKLVLLYRCTNEHEHQYVRTLALRDQILLEPELKLNRATQRSCKYRTTDRTKMRNFSSFATVYYRQKSDKRLRKSNQNTLDRA